MEPSPVWASATDPETEASPVSTSATNGRDCVVLLHGLGRTPRSMRRLAADLARKGYRVVNAGYASNRAPIEHLAAEIDGKIGEIAECGAASGGRVHFVTHSMGGILIRYYLKARPLSNLGRVVMLVPPNGGAELVDFLRRVPVIRDLMGPSLRQLGTRSDDLPARLGPVDYEVGVIAGDWSWNPIFSLLIPGPDDGAVSVARTKVPGMTDFVTVPRGHTFIMNGRNVIDQVERFLREGSFDHAGRDPRADRGDQTPAGKAGPAVAGEAVRVGIRSRRGYLTHGLRQA